MFSKTTGLLLLLPLLLTACGGAADQTSLSNKDISTDQASLSSKMDVSGDQVNQAKKVDVSGDKGSFTDAQICIAAIALTMSKDVSIATADAAKGGVSHLSYVRKSDGKKWEYRCKLDGNKVIWGTKTGRWRTEAYDAKLTFSVKGRKVDILETHDDGSTRNKTYDASELKG